MAENRAPVVYLKLGGSLITDKRQPEMPRLDVIRRLAAEIKEARRVQPNMRLVIGHGSGSFGHLYGQRHNTRAGVDSAEGWFGFAETADAATRLCRIVVGELLQVGLPAWGIQPSVALRCRDGRVVDGPIQAVAHALEKGLLPVVHGDVALDDVRGGTIASTEEIFAWLAEHLPPLRLILAGEVDGIFTADPQLDSTAQLIDALAPEDVAEVRAKLSGSYGVDVTGGMSAKVDEVFALIERHPQLKVLICSGLREGNLLAALTTPEAAVGTRLSR